MNPSKRILKCKNCNHEVRRSIDLGSYVNPNNLWHYVDGYGSKLCSKCDCNKPECGLVAQSGRAG
ncbi:MAG: hypothetical protein ACETWG_12280, partial [Candidatus Neomarinimicrobiota bacterium]